MFVIKLYVFFMMSMHTTINKIRQYISIYIYHN